MIHILYILISAITAALSAFSIKKYSKDHKTYWLALSLLTANLMVLFYYQVFQFGNASSMYVIIKLLSILVMLLFSFFFFREMLSLKKMIGVALSLVAIVLLST
jgi:uncharacterized membrane protein